MLGWDELEDILDAITAKVVLANRTETLKELLQSWGLADLLQSDSSYATDPKGKIVVIGGTEIKEAVLTGVIKSLGLDKNRFEFCLL